MNKNRTKDMMEKRREMKKQKAAQKLDRVSTGRKEVMIPMDVFKKAIPMVCEKCGCPNMEQAHMLRLLKGADNPASDMDSHIPMPCWACKACGWSPRPVVNPVQADERPREEKKGPSNFDLMRKLVSVGHSQTCAMGMAIDGKDCVCGVLNGVAIVGD